MNDMYKFVSVKTKMIYFMTGRIFKVALLSGAIMAFHVNIHAQQKKAATQNAGIILPIENGRVMADLRGKNISKDEISSKLNAILNLSPDNTFSQVANTKDELGIAHFMYQQYYRGVKVDGGQILIHVKDGIVNSVNGSVAPLSTFSILPVLKKEEAYGAAKKAMALARLSETKYPVTLVIATAGQQYVLAYKTQIDGTAPNRAIVMTEVYIDAVTGKTLKTNNLIANVDVTGSGNTLYSGTKTFTMDSTAQGFRLRDNARKIETYDGGRSIVNNQVGFTTSADFTNSTSFYNLFKTFQSSGLTTVSPTLLNGLGTSNELYFGLTQGALPSITTDAPVTSPQFVPVSGASGLPVTVLNLYGIIDPSKQYAGAFMNLTPPGYQLVDSAVYSFSGTAAVGAHNWSDTKGNSGNYNIGMMKSPATDVHWGMQKTYDFYLTVFNRNSFDNQGGVIRNYVNFGSPNNAGAAPGTQPFMMYGMGDGSFMNPVVALDILGHEFTHLVTANNGHGGLQVGGEPGALNESFSDIMGTCIDFFANGSQGNWISGEGVIIPAPGFGRSLQQPKLTKTPDTYKGEYWKDPTDFNEDAGGVHANNGVQNKWFYLLCMGGSGTNDKGDAYNVTGITIEKARKIAYRNLMQYILPTSTYMDAYNGSLQATIDLYGSTTSPEYIAVKKAWFAVGIGDNTGTSVNEIALTDNDLKLYPNPATGKVTIVSSIDQKLEAQILNVAGVAVMNITVSKGQNPIDISSLAKGMYMIRYNTGAKGFVQKLSVL
jgi:Zn-dependent metalloprotease